MTFFAIEKNFISNKTSQVTRDHVLSATPQEFRNLVNIGKIFKSKNISSF